jgi:TRAP-type C4-dicarboxylate transport system permease small subunit
MMGTVVRIFDRIVLAAAWVGGVATVLMMLHITADVTGRTLFHKPITGTVEIVSAYHMAALSFLPLALIARRRGHIIVELFTQGLRWRARSMLDGIVAILTLVYTSIFTCKEAGIGFIEIWPARWLVAVGFGLMAVAVLIQCLHDLRAGITGERGPEDPELLRVPDEGL